MQKITLDRVYRTAIYLRLSKEDGDFSLASGKVESNSISSQRLLIMEYVGKHPELDVVREFSDDGYTGSNFDRPQFQTMMDAVRNGDIDCIIVKDLSRFGREYIDSGMYIQKIFPALGVRFIAINDNYDNAQPSATDNEIILPFKNLINDSYCRDISIKIRTNLDARRRNGQFVGSHAVYGYMKSPDDKGKLIIDREAADIVQNIYRWKIEGQSPEQIAESLNQSGVLSPIEYKKSKGSKYKSGFQTSTQAMWSAVAVYRILKNEIYTGVLLQGKTTTPNHKIKKRSVKDESEWIRIDNAHDAIIPRTQFELVRRIMHEDTRRSATDSVIHLFSGKVYCADCGSAMIRRTSKTKDNTYIYLTCAGNKAQKGSCTSHMIRESVIYDAVLSVLQAHVKVALDMSDALRQIDELSWEKRELQNLQAQIDAQENVIQKYVRLKVESYEDYRNDILTKDELGMFREEFNAKIRDAKRIICELHDKQYTIKEDAESHHGWLDRFKEYENFQELNRSIVVNLVDRINIYSDKTIEVKLLYGDQFASMIEFINEHHNNTRVVGVS